jgi:hypothetical protein
MSNKKNILDSQIEQAEREILLAKYQTALKKGQFINDLKAGLGEEVKAIGGKVKVIEKSWWLKIKAKLIKIFTKF